MADTESPRADVELRNAGPWEHHDGSPCPHYMASRPRPNDDDWWWCTEHQQHVRVATIDRLAAVDTYRTRLLAPRADVELTPEDRVALIRGANDAWASGATSVSALVGDLEAVVERILADRLAAVQAEARESRRLMLNAEGVAAGETYLREEAEKSRDAYRGAMRNAEALAAHEMVRREKAEARAESAEAERDDLRARLLAVEALVGEAVFADFTTWPEVGEDVVLAVRADDLRAVHASPSTHTQRDTDTAAQALREAADDPTLSNGYPRIARWLRARADSLAAGEGS
jgi:hypothetical protein